jgi:hypothetical protein
MWNAGSWMDGMVKNTNNLVGSKKGLRYVKKGQSLMRQAVTFFCGQHYDLYSR